MRRRQHDRRVAFADQVQVHGTDEDIEQFQLLNDHEFAENKNRDPYHFQGQRRVAGPQQHPQSHPSGDTGGSLSDTSGTRRAGGDATHHFLDRALTSDIPNYIHHLQHLWRERDARVDDAEGYQLRTWYVRSPDVPQWKRPRRCEVEGDGSHWHHDILSSWRDILLNHQRLIIAVVHPSLRMPRSAPPPHADLILVQGDPDWCGGLITVYPPNADDDARYTWAATLPRHLSGHDILRGADALGWIAEYPCQIYHDWQQIPVDDVPRHWMLNGHSFVVIFQSSSAEPSAASSTVPVTHANTQLDSQAADCQEEPEEEEPEEEATPSATSPEHDTAYQDEEDLHGLQVFSLSHEPHHCFVRWTTYNTILFDTLSSIGLSSDQAVGYHYLQAPLIDQHEAEECIILQRVGDIPGGSPDRLLLIDITIQHHEKAKTTYERRVHLVPRVLRRAGLMEQLRFQAFCTWQDDRCIVYFNNEIWNSAELAPRQTEHGTYIRVVVMAPEDTDIDTHQAIQIADEAAEHVPERPTKSRRTDVECEQTSSGTTRGHQLLQLQQSRFQSYKHLISHSMTTPSLGPVPGAQHGPDAHFVLPPQQQADRWLLQAGMTFMEKACTEYPDEGPVATWVTWYLHTGRLRRNSESRLLRLDVEQHLWYQDLCELWADVLDPMAAATVHFVHPPPPTATHQEHVGHLILLQGEDDHVPVLLSGIFQQIAQNRLWHVAVLVPEFMTGQDLCVTLEVDRWCNHRLCYVECGGDLVQYMHLARLQSGDSVVITITNALPPSVHHVDHDDTNLMQGSTRRWTGSRRAHRQHAVDTPGGTAECHAFQFNAGARPFTPGGPLLPIETQSEDVQQLHHIWEEHAFAWEEEDRSSTVAVWFVDHAWARPHGHHYRIVRLWPDYTRWAQDIVQAWRDALVPGAWIEWHIVMPKPFTADTTVMAHIVIIQNPVENWVTNIVTVTDATQTDYHPRQMAVTTHEHIFLDNILRVFNLYEVCLAANAPFQCLAWYGDLPMHPGVPVMGRSGTSIQGQIRHRRTPTLPTTGPVLLQLHAALGLTETSSEAPCERLTHGSVAHDRGPQGTAFASDFPAIGERDEIEDDSLRQNVLVEVILPPNVTHEQTGLPEFLETPAIYDDVQLQQELSAWGFQGQAFLCGPHDAIFIESQHNPPQCTVYCHEDPTAPGGIRVRDQLASSDEIVHMKFLYEQGFHKAVVMRMERWSDHTTCVHFTNVEPAAEPMSRPPRIRTPWPTCQPVQEDRSTPFRQQVPAALPDCRLELDHHVLMDFFEHGRFALCTDLAIFDLPDLVKDFIAACKPVERADRYVIYTDGSSHSRHKHKPPLWIEEHDVSDTWCFAVFKEQYQDLALDVPPRLEFVGLTCQQVLYEHERPHHVGTTHVGSDAAETEALLWSALWRIAQNDRLPTIFISDSQMAGQQAAGIIGTGAPDAPYRYLRAAFQALEAMLPHDLLRIEHTRSHAGDPGNELVDHFAKLEAQKSLYLSRQPVDFHQFGAILPHLWMILSAQDDVPRFYGAGFDLTAPALPVTSSTTSTSQKVLPHEKVHFTMSFATANVCTFYHGAEGVPGKVDYVRQQFLSTGLLFLGLQETRTSECTSLVDQVYRIAGGARKGHEGVELWINLQQPFAYLHKRPLLFRRSHFVVVHREPRLLLVRVHNHHLDFWILTYYAPQSGLPMEERQRHWAQAQSVCDQYVRNQPLVVLMDANAATGPADYVHVFDYDDRMSANSALLRDFLQANHLFLPSTTHLHQGDHTTWTSPIDGMDYRIDYIALPSSWFSSCVSSSVIDYLDIGPAQDHSAVACELDWWSMTTSASPSAKPLGHDRHAIKHCQLSPALQACRPSSWSTDIETHVEDTNSQLLSVLHAQCPVPAAGPKKPIFDEATWTLRSDKLHWAREMKQLRKLQTQQTLAGAFAAWRGTQQPDTGHHYGTTLRCRRLHVGCRFQLCARRLRSALKKAKQKVYASTIDTLPAEAPASQILQTVRPLLGPSNPKKRKTRPLPIIHDEDGKPCTDPDALRDRWIDFFRAMECGSRLSDQQLRDQWIANLNSFVHQELVLLAEDIPSLVDLELAYRRVQPGKAVGSDRIPPELCHAQPKHLARLTYTQLVKLVSHGQEALCHKGGQLVAAWKGKGSQAHCEAYRSLLISSHIGKTLHRALRDQQSAIYEKFLHFEQLGGRKRVPVGIGLHHARGSLRRAKQRGWSSALLFLDLREAFYRVIRPLAVGGTMNDAVLAQIAQRLSLDHEALRLFADRPDDANDAQKSLGPVWMDDLCIPLSAPTAGEIERQAGLAFGVLLDLCAKYGVTPNLDRGKSEILFAFRGKGSRSLKSKYFSENHARSLQVITETGIKAISVVGHYTHLGGRAHHSGESRQDMRQRISIGYGAFNAHRKTLLQNPAIAPARRRELYVTLVHSKITYGTESWVLTDQGNRQYFHCAIVRMYRRLLKLPHDAHESDDSIIAAAGLPSPSILLRVARLRYIGCLYRCSDVAPWHVINEDETWLQHVRQDFQWMWRLLHNTTSLRDPSLHFGDWEYILKYHRSYWRRLLQRAVALEHLHLQDRLLLTKLHYDVYQHLQAHGTVVATLTCPTQFSNDPAQVFGCMLCRRRCKSKGGEGAHLCKTHGIVARTRYLFDGTCCPSCLREYHTFAKLQAHLQRDARCRHFLQGQPMHRTPAPGKGSHANEVLHSQHDGLLPVQQAQGPRDDRRLPGAGDVHHLGLYEALGLIFFAPVEDRPDDLFHAAQQCIYDFPVGWTTVRATLQYMSETLTSDDAELAQIDLADWQAVLRRLGDYKEWPFLSEQPEEEPTEPHIHLAELETWCDTMAAHAEPFRRRVQEPPPVFAERIIVHAFSGRRRPGDFQWYVDAMAKEKAFADVYVVSLDLVIDEDWGDISKPATYEFWLSAIRSGYVIGFLAGPPCCTWSVARGKQDQSMKLQGRVGPRAVRSAEELWGFTSLSLREKRQVMDGHRLLAFSLIAMLLLYTTDGFGVVEHPDEPHEEDAPSIWKLPLMHMLLALQGFHKISLAQGLLGASSVKRTGLLVLNLERLPFCIRRFAVCPNLPCGRNIGLSADGTFKTTVLKEYPPALCAGFADAFITGISTLPVSKQPIPDVVLNRMRSMVCTTMGQTVGPDYAGH
eukprot:s39_g30.t1